LELHSWASGQSISAYLFLKRELKIKKYNLEKIEILLLLYFPHMKSQHVGMGEKINTLDYLFL